MLALIAGQGTLPRMVVKTQPEPPLVCALEGFLPEGLAPDIVFRLEHLGSLFNVLREKGVSSICFCGSIRRPLIDPARIDAETQPLVAQLQNALTKGDDGALRIVMQLFETAGFAITAAHDLVPDLLLSPGIPTISQTAPQHAQAARLGAQTVASMGARDTGQACIVNGGVVIAREDAAGTDAMILRVARDRGYEAQRDASWNPFDLASGVVDGLLDSASDFLSGAASPKDGGLLYKAPKPDQDRRADLPVIGPATADHAAAAKLDGIVIEAGGVMVLQRDVVLDRLNRHGLFLWVRERDG